MATKARSIQFFDIDSILQVYKELNIPNFAIWHDNQLMFPHESDDMDESLSVLENYLDNLKDSPTIYSIRFYKHLKEDISTKTDYNGSFNFRLKDPQEIGRQIIGSSSYQAQYNNALESRLQALTLSIEQLNKRYEEQEDTEPAEDPKQGLGAITAFLDHPIIQLLTNKIFSSMGGQQQPIEVRRPAISGVPSNNATPGTNAINATQAQPGTSGIYTLNESLQILQQADPSLDVHLAKLAELSQRDPESFNFLLQTLDKL